MASPPSTAVIEALASDLHQAPTSAAFAAALDSSDSLSRFRRDFAIPRKGEMPESDCPDPEADCVYLGGNSIGLQPRRFAAAMAAFTSHWARFGVMGHRHGFPEWEKLDIETAATVAQLVGASAEEVAVMNSATVNLHLLLLSFYRPTAARWRILCEESAFPSDFYVFQSQSSLRGFKPEEAVIRLRPRKGEWCLRSEDIVRVIAERGHEIAVVCLPGVQYLTGQLFDVPAITRAGQEAGCVVGWDMCHAIGNVELRLHDWCVDFATWCHYKYVCAGPGAIAGAFVHSRHAGTRPPTLYGWWAHEAATRFRMDNRMRMVEGAKAYQMSCPSPANTVGVRVGAELLLEAGIGALRAKSTLLTGYLEFLLLRGIAFSGSQHLQIITPADPEQRGAQLSVRFPVNVEAVHAELTKRGAICDLRSPDILRFAPLPIYNSFSDVHRLVGILEDVLEAAGIASRVCGNGVGEGRPGGEEAPSSDSCACQNAQ